MDIPLVYGLFALITGSFIWLLVCSIRHRNSVPILVQVILVAGLIGVSAVTIKIEREFIAYPIAVGAGLVLGMAAFAARTQARSRLVDTAAIFFAFSLSLLSLNIDWFDARGVITAGLLLSVSFLVPPGISTADGRSAKLAVILLAGGAFVLLWMVFGSIFGADQLVASVVLYAIHDRRPV